MQTQTVLDDFDQQVNELSTLLTEQMAGSFEKVITTEEGKEILRKTYRDELVGLWEELPDLGIKTIDQEDLEKFIQKLGEFLRELKKSIQYPHRKKVNNQFIVWQKIWGAENIPWIAFLENCSDDELEKLDGLSLQMGQLDIPRSVVRNLISRWLGSEFIALAQMEKSGILLIQWAREVLENSKWAIEYEKWFGEVGQTSLNLPNQLSRFLAEKWIGGKKNDLEKLETFAYHWKISTPYQSCAQEWKNILDKLQNMKPILPSLKSQEIALFEKYYRYIEINLETLENIKRDVQTIITLRERLAISELSVESPKLEVPGFPDVATLITSAPKNQVKLSVEKDTPGSYIVHIRGLVEQVPAWQAEFRRVAGKIIQIANSWYLRAQNREIPASLLETINKMMAACTHIGTMADLAKAHNLLVFVQEDMKEILTADLGEFTSKVFREINSRLDQTNSIPVDEILSLHSEPEVELALFNLVRQNLIKLEIKR